MVHLFDSRMKLFGISINHTINRPHILVAMTYYNILCERGCVRVPYTAFC